MNTYEQKLERRRAHLNRAADTATAKSNAGYETAKRIGSHIPFGQPVLVNHHSAKRHRKDLERIDRGMRLSVEEGKRAEVLRRRADSVGENGISADDPDAIQKLDAKLQVMLSERETMKKANAAFRKAGWPGVEVLLGADVRVMLEQNSKRFGRDGEAPYPAFKLTNIRGRISQVEGRLVVLRREQEARVNAAFEVAEKAARDAAASIDAEVTTIVQEALSRELARSANGTVVAHERFDLNRVTVTFPSRVSKEVVKVIRGWGFVWSPTNGCWQRQLNDNGRRAAKQLLGQLERVST